ncbi:branched-chain amino acid ABC transporter permease/ATP-binding protein [Pseudofrankia sp. BMG5.37]|uniref:branched-chain amino acid ABC transporter permease/ATP-binding protein n=1 Tax=Pseudofrankia sp. BMG5.37 TaxID=3050035 RepID=UPI00289484C1|nr:branched-chain amino acid ABC transporter permease/ATP-binding protein [Pseudofrankia sp. BMG5.37]MDT3441416.1 branched-chain amino acid ABC transporter permease/ATP-binding protein [Pseudofrankia sp. BMG5.37]
MSQLWQFALIGLAGGGAYALVALGVVAVYRGSGILNFAQGAIGMVGSYIFWDLHAGGAGGGGLYSGTSSSGGAHASLPVAPAMAIGVASGAVLGLLFYLVVVRLLRNSPDMAKVVATLGLMLLLQSVVVKRYGTESHLLPPLFGHGKITIFSGVITNDTLAILIVTLALALGLWLMFGKTKLGMNATALRENPVAASAIGISPHPTGLITWGVGGAVAAFAGILLIPVIGLTPDALTLLVIPAMAAALVGRFNAVWITVVVGLALGVAESVMRRYDVNLGIVSSLPFAVIIVSVILGGAALPGRGEALTGRLPRAGTGRFKPVTALVWVVAAVAIPLFASPSWSAATINSTLFGLLALSIVVVTGYAGQISVACAALAGFAAFIAARMSNDLHLPFLLCVLLGTVAAVVLGVVFGAPAVRVRGVNLAIVTLGLSLAVENLVLTQPSMTGGLDGLTVHDPSLFGLNISPSAHPNRFALVCLAAFVLASVAVLNLRRGEAGRRFLAVRANERGAASVGVSVPGAKLGAFAISAGIAGLAGALSAFQFRIADFTSYGVFRSISALAFTVVGGVGYVAGAVFSASAAAGGVVANAVSDWLSVGSIDAWLPIATGLVVLDAMVRSPSGIIPAQAAIKDGLVRLVVRLTRRPAEPAEPAAAGATATADGIGATGETGSAAADEAAVSGGAAANGGAARRPLAFQPSCPVPAGGTVLVARDIEVRYGNTVAVGGVSFELTAGRVVGVIGPNGAGKTSLIDALTGFARTAGGTVELLGRDVTALRAPARARLGLGRTFQNLELFDDLSVRENILTALDGRGALAYIRDLAYPRRGSLSDTASAAVTMLGLDDVLDTVVADLPQGRRRMVAIARLVAQRPAAVLLDEPAAGLGGAERRTASALFRRLAAESGAAVLLVEHNIDVVASTCDHVVVLDFGRVIASGRPDEVLRDPAVRAAYLGQLSSEAAEAAAPEPVAAEGV